MQKNYIVTLIFSFLFLISFQGFSQSEMRNISAQQQQNSIEGLSIYPNPVSNGKLYIYITSKHNLTKTIEIYNVLGKRISSTILTGKELSISQLGTGVYILKITENNISETRKLVIK